ncbi:hypothetical protein KR044_011835, partial [Drosophila immigrans]
CSCCCVSCQLIVIELLNDLFRLIVVARIEANCLVSDADILATNRIFAKPVGSQLELLRNNVVPIGTRLRLLCSASDFVDSTCRANRRFVPTLPSGNCTRKPETIVELVEDDKCRFSMFRVGYKLNANQFLEIYRSCYDTTTQRSLFSIHELHRHNLNPPRGGCWRVTDVVVTIPSYLAKNIYARFNEIFNGQQSYITGPRRPYKFNRGHLAPSADFGFCDQMRATFRYINAVAQFAQVNDSNWKRVENWVRFMRDQFGKITVCTGSIGVLQLDDRSGNPKDIYLVRGDLNPVPEWTYKIIKSHTNRNIHYAVITYNHAENPAQPAPLCNPIPCRNLGLEFNAAPNSGYSFCCDGNDFIN